MAFFSKIQREQEKATLFQQLKFLMDVAPKTEEETERLFESIVKILDQHPELKEDVDAWIMAEPSLKGKEEEVERFFRHLKERKRKRRQL